MPSFNLQYVITADGRKARSELESVETQIAKLGGAASKASGLSATQLNAVAIGAGAVTTGIIAIGAAAVNTAQFLFDLSKQAADFGSIIYDSSQKTGLHAETLSALKFGAEQAGTEFEKVTKAVTVFGVEVGKAASGNEEAAAKMKDLGVTSADLDTALKQVFKTIFNGKTDVEKLRLATEAFGKKIGPDLIPLIKDSRGNLDELVRTAKRLGATINDDAAREADEFSDTLEQLGIQVTSLGRQIASPLIPRITQLAKALSDLLVDNQTALTNWQKHTSLVFDGVIGYWEDLRKAVASYNLEVGKSGGGSFPGGTGFGGPLGLSPGQQRPIIGSIDDLITQRGRQRQTMGGNIVTDTPSPFSFPDPLKAAEDAKDAAEKRSRDRESAFKKELAAQSRQNALLLQSERETFTSLNKAWEEAFLKGEADKETFREKALNNITAYGQKAQALLDQQRTRDLQSATTGTERENVLIQFKNAGAALYNDLQRERADLEKTIGNVVKQTAEVDEKNRKDSLATWGKARDVQKDIYDVLTDQIDAEQKLHDERKKSWSEYIKDLIKAGELADEEADRRAKEEQDLQRLRMLRTTVGSGAAISAIDQLHDTFAGQGNSAALIGIETLTDAMSGLGQAIGQVVQAWVLYGASGQSVRQVTAQILAGIAQQAAVKAIFELAEGFAALALAFFGIPNAGPSAAAHFTAAATYGAIAGVAAIAGRKVAGDSFNKSGTSAGSGSSSGSSGDQYRHPVSRVSNDAFISGSRNQDNFVLTAAINALNDKLSSMPEGEVLINGMKQRKGAVSRQMLEEFKSNSSHGVQLKRVMGDR